jgi:hypothetical protein
MGNDGVKFYQVFKFGGTIGVNSLTFSELLMVNGGTLIVMMLLLGVLAFIFPILMLLMYTILILSGNWEQNQINRVRVNIFAIIGYIYFMIDYHFGFIGWGSFYIMFGAEFIDKLCYVNTGLLLLNILLMFFGNKLFNEIESGYSRLSVFILILFLSSKILVPIGKSLTPLIITQHVPKPDDDIVVIINNGKYESTESDEDMMDEDMMDLDDEIEKHENGRNNYNEPDEYIGRD